MVGWGTGEKVGRGGCGGRAGGGGGWGWGGRRNGQRTLNDALDGSVFPERFLCRKGQCTCESLAVFGS